MKRPSYLTTCEQAEVLYPEQVSLSYLKRIYVAEVEHCDMITGLLKDFDHKDVEVIVQPEKFEGYPN